MSYNELKEQLEQAKHSGYVTENYGLDGLSIYCYTRSCNYDRAWNDATILARGLVVHHESQKIIATPFPKFFNVFECNQTIPNLPFEVFDKIDGSLIILFCHNGCWYSTTKRLFDTRQSQMSRPLLGNLNELNSNYTYLLELIGPDNQIVIRYNDPKLYLLGVYDEFGYELNHEQCIDVVSRAGWEIAKRHHFDTFDQAYVYSKSLPATEEGYVIRFENGFRLKVKGEEYCRIHANISGVTPLGIWNMMRNEDNLEEIRKSIPEEFYHDLDTLQELLNNAYQLKLNKIAEITSSVSHLSDKELGLILNTFPDDIRNYIFTFRKNPNNSSLRKAIFRDIRPNFDYIDGYVSSAAIDRLVEEEDA